ncbi:MAG: isochorismate synthase [Phototrophicales bacterium]|nr:MAG: isochorismate synthase [Phototrophicales bacterium]
MNKVYQEALLLNTSITERLISDSLPCPDVSLLDFLMHSQGQPRFYWENSQDQIAFAGSGKAVEFIEWGNNYYAKLKPQIQQLFSGAILLNSQEPLAAPRLFGGFAFHPEFVPDNTWASFAPAHFVLPHYQLLSISGETWLTINANIPYEENVDEIRDELRRALKARIEVLQRYAQQKRKTQLPKLQSINYPLPYEIWEQTIQDATEQMRKGVLQKIVLARVAEAQFDESIDVVAPLSYLANTYPNTYRFLFESRPFHAFYGATPELLVSVSGTTIKTMALAGSIRRGNTAEEDNTYANTLLNSTKDRYEHQVVVDQIQHKLHPLVHSLHISEPQIMRLANIQHIHTRIEGTLKSANGVLPLVEVLHPTPALGGHPTDVAMQLIQTYESVPRGWYAAPIGWIDGNLDGEFGVGIRSAVTQHRRVWMYAGAGIVESSIAQKEWEEIELKFKPMLHALGITDR